MDTCIALRTAVVKDKKLYVQAGGGVVYDSTPQYEYDETVNKAAALFRAPKLRCNWRLRERTAPNADAYRQL